jgi:hypothetical protein
MADQDRYVTVKRRLWENLRADRNRLEKELAEARDTIATMREQQDLGLGDPVVDPLAAENERLRAVERAAIPIAALYAPEPRTQPWQELIVALAAARADAKPIEELVDRSSLGTPGAKALRDSVPQELVDRALRRADEIAACSAPPAACIHEWIYIDDVYANCRHCSAILAPAAAEAEGADEPCPDCLGTGRDGGSSAPCPTCLRTADAGAGGGWVAPSIDDAARAINDHAIVRTTAGTIRELQEKLRAAEAALADEKRMSGHLQEQWHASDVKLQVAEAERDAQKSLATSLHQAGSDLIASLERAQRQRADAVDRAAAVEAERDDWKRLCEAGRKAFLGELPQRLEATQRDVEYRTQERDEARARIASLTGLLERALPHVSEARGRSGSLPEHVQIEADIRGVLEHRPEGDGGKL